MEIALLNQRITFQRNAILTDHIGNHTSSWNDEFSCYATVGGESGRNGKETAVAGGNGGRCGLYLYCALVRTDGECWHDKPPHFVQ